MLYIYSIYLFVLYVVYRDVFCNYVVFVIIYTVQFLMFVLSLADSILTCSLTLMASEHKGSGNIA